MDDSPIDEATLIAMSEDDYMNDIQRRFFLHYLQRLKADHEARLAEVRESLVGKRCWGDAMDRAVGEANQAGLAKRAERDSQQLRRINAALERLHRGEFGYCLQTDAPIGLRRLLLDPATEFCLEEQARREHAHTRK